MTSNLGSELIQETFETIPDVDTAMETAKRDVLGLLKKMVRPEFLNRIDDTVLFTPLTKKDIEAIVSLQLKSVSKLIKKQGITFDTTEDAIVYLAKKGYQPEYGARPVKRLIQKEVLNALSKALLAGTISKDSIILLDVFEDQIVFRNQTDLISNTV